MNKLKKKDVFDFVYIFMYHLKLMFQYKSMAALVTHWRYN